MNFNEVSFWIQIWNVPVACMTEKCAIFLGNLIRVLEDTKVSGSRMQFRVKIDVKILLQRGLHMFMTEVSREVSLLLQYEYLLDFCYDNGIIRHQYKECTKRRNEKNNPYYLAKKKYGP
ncbi:hypothetical protein PanWU01x14_292810 [Parasponia andersonii]|uniref:DUF4283 domain-containing protein n=1 Tax=Parasponia andersonii TaxID=3476 RepID=A0A2P5AWT2_PARAD|nr:hypothetical protein PanWU01x14_292810 [Parasponia andersonii]